MRRVLRWTGIGIGVLLGLVVLAYLVLHLYAEHLLRERHAIPAVALAVSNTPASIAEGARLARVHGCIDGCHGKDMQGEAMIDDPMIGRIVAPNLTAAAGR